MPTRTHPFAGALAGFAAGTALTYLLDPQSGRRRRAQVKDKADHLARETRIALEAAERDLAHRMRGLAWETAARLEEHGVDDHVLHERVRSELGRVCSHPGAVEVDTHQGTVGLRGPILEEEASRVLRRIGKVRGVKKVEDHLERHDASEALPALQGGVQRRPRFEFFQEHWAPGPRLLAGVVGLGLGGYGLLRGRPLSLGFGLGLFLRSATNLPVNRLYGLGAGRRGIDLVKQLHVDAPIEEVFAFWRAFENFPRFMPHVREVKTVADGRYHWAVKGPAGMPIEWDAEISAYQPNQLIAWRSVPGAIIPSAGIVRFEPHERGGTRLNLRMTYNPPAGAIGHAFAKLLGADPKKQLDEDLLRFKSLIEVGKATGREETVTRDELSPEPRS